MIASAAQGTLLERMVARVAEPQFALPLPLTTPAAWGEEIAEVAAPAPAPFAFESRRADPVVQPAEPGHEAAPQIVRQEQEVESVAIIAPTRAMPTAQPPVAEPLRADEPVEQIVEVPQRSAVVMHETTVLVPARMPQVPIPETRASAPANVQLDVVLPLREAGPEYIHAPALRVPQRKQPAPLAVQPDLPATIPIAEKATTASVPAEPVIHVTIGRLEVRTPERERKSRPAAQGAPQSGPTLQQYLAKRRSGGGT
jgi:hypothetical protein